MAQETKSCPTKDELSSFLSGSTGDSTRLAKHVDACSSCQLKLDRLSEAHYLAPFQTTIQKAHSSSQFLEPHADDSYLGQIDGIAIVSQIGAGGMGIVFRGEDLKLGRTVAVKILKRGSSYESNRRFLREIRAAASLKHPNLLPVYSAGNALDGRPYLVMPFVEGNSLKHRLEISLPASGHTATMVREIALGLQHAHDQGIAHRDIKPGNILLDSSDETAKLADFGLVRNNEDETLTQQDVICGTPEYMCPDSGSESADYFSSDIYSLGIVLYECLTGTTPFRGQPLDVLDQHRTADPLPPRSLNRDIPVDLETICLKAIAKEPGRRYASAAQLAEDLQRFVDDRPILAKRESLTGKAKRWGRRNFALAVTITLATLLLTTATGVSTWLWYQSEKNAGLARERADSIAQINVTLQKNQDELFGALQNSPAVRLTSVEFASELPTGVRNQLMLEMADTWRILFNRVQDDQSELQKMAQQLADVTDVADQMGMKFRRHDLTQLSSDIADQLVASEDSTPKALLVASRIYQQRAETVRSTVPEAAAENIIQAVQLVESVLKEDDLPDETRTDAMIRQVSLKRDIADQQNDKKIAKKELLELLASLKEIDTFDPDSDFDRQWYRQHEKTLLSLAEISRPAEAIDFRESRGAVLKALVETAEFTSSEFNLQKRKLAVNNVFIANTWARIGNTEAAEEGFTAAIKSLEQLTFLYPQNSQYRADLFETNVLFAGLLDNLGRTDQASKRYDKAIDLHRLSARLNPTDPAIHQRLAAVLELVARRQVDEGKSLDSASKLYEAGKMLEKINVFVNFNHEKNVQKMIALYVEARDLFDEADDPRADEVESSLSVVRDRLN